MPIIHSYYLCENKVVYIFIYNNSTFKQVNNTYASKYLYLINFISEISYNNQLYTLYFILLLTVSVIHDYLQFSFIHLGI